MDKNNRKRKFKSLSSASSKKITNFFKTVEQKSSDDNAHSSPENYLKTNAIHKKDTVKDVVLKSPERDVDHFRIKEEKCVKKNNIKEKKCKKKDRINEQKCEKKTKNANIEDANNPDHLNASMEQHELKSNNGNDHRSPNKDLQSNEIHNENTGKHVAVDQRHCVVTYHRKSGNRVAPPTVLPMEPYTKTKQHAVLKSPERDVDHSRIKEEKCIKKNISNQEKCAKKNNIKEEKCEKKNGIQKSNNVGDKSKKSLVLFNFLNIQQSSERYGSAVKVNEEKCDVKCIKSSSKFSTESRKIKDESSNNHESVKYSKSLISKSPEKKKSITNKHKKTSSADNSIFTSIEKDPKPDLRECQDMQKSEVIIQKKNIKKRRRQRCNSNSETDNSIQSLEEVVKKEVCKRSTSLNNSSILRYISPSKDFYKNKCNTESEEQDSVNDGGSKKRKYSSDLEQVKKVGRKKKKFCNMTKSVNGLDSWLCSKSSKTKQVHNKYGMKVPSYMNIMKNVQRRKQYSEQLKEARKIIDSQRFEVSSVEKIEDADDGHNSSLLSCTHLSLELIEQYFTCFKEDCLDIINGRVWHDRHDKYMNRARKDMVTMNFLVYNVSTVVFSIEQKKTLANLCEKYFDNCDIYKPTQYYFKVLIPELCLKIFMKVHGMDKDTANEYLENMPVLED